VPAAHGGTVGVDSSPSGTSFTVRLPATGVPAQDGSAERRAAAAVPSVEAMELLHRGLGLRDPAQAVVCAYETGVVRPGLH
jgi:hypothetical protein